GSAMPSAADHLSRSIVSLGSTHGAGNRGARLEDQLMPPDPKRVQDVFLAAVKCHEPSDRAAVLDAECSGDAELRQRVEVRLAAHDQFDDSLDVPLAGFRRGMVPPTGPERKDCEVPPDDTFIGAARAPDLSSGSESDLTVAAGARGAPDERTNRVPAIEGYE